MKKYFLILLLLTFISPLALFAQQDGEDGAAFYPKLMYISKIYPHRLGYRIDYRRDDNSVGTFFAPVEWFRESGGYGQIGYGEGSMYPYMMLFFQDGEIHHFRLFLIEDVMDYSWGSLDSEVDWAPYFDVEKPEITFYKDSE